MMKWLKGKSFAFNYLDNYLVKRDGSAIIKEFIGLRMVTLMGSGLALRVAK